MEFILISSPQAIENEWEILSELFRKGLQRFHLRKPHWDKNQYQKALEKIDTAFHQRIIIHDFPILAQDFGLGGIHLKEGVRKGLDVETWEEILKHKKANSLSLSTSVHSLGDWNQLNEAFEYAFLSPVFDSLSKKGYRASKDWQHPILRHSRSKAIALGGIDVDKISQLHSWNYDGLAALGAVWNHPSQAIVRTLKLIKACQEHVHMC